MKNVLKFQSIFTLNFIGLYEEKKKKHTRAYIILFTL
jgi:hypothetical protein